MLEFSKKSILVACLIVAMIIFFSLMIVISWDSGERNKWPVVAQIIQPAANQTDWTVNLCAHYNETETCEQVPTQQVNYLSDEQLRWWFDFQEAINQGQYEQADYEKFKQTTPLIDQHTAKIIAWANPVGYTALAESNLYVFPRSRMSPSEIEARLNQPSSWGGEIMDGEFPKVRYSKLIGEAPASDIVVGAELIGKITGEALCRQRTSFNLLIDLVRKKIVYLDREVEYDDTKCKIER